MNDQGVACLMFGIYEKTASGVMDRRECAACKGDDCPYVSTAAPHGPCPLCFGTGLAPAGVFDLRDDDSHCARCGGTGRV